MMASTYFAVSKQADFITETKESDALPVKREKKPRTTSSAGRPVEKLSRSFFHVARALKVRSTAKLVRMRSSTLPPVSCSMRGEMPTAAQREEVVASGFAAPSAMLLTLFAPIASLTLTTRWTMSILPRWVSISRQVRLRVGPGQRARARGDAQCAHLLAPPPNCFIEGNAWGAAERCGSGKEGPLSYTSSAIWTSSSA